MHFGALIEKGPMNWQIIQQENGFADIELSGSWVSTDNSKAWTVYVRIVSEDSGTPVISWQRCDSVGDNGWHTVINQVPTGGLYRIETCLNKYEENNLCSVRGDLLHHIGVGDIYVIAGQSNSAGFGRDPVFDPPELGVHLYRNSGLWDLASHPMNDSTSIIHEANYEAALSGHSPYLSFAKMLKRSLGYPIGLIQASLGGSPLRKWNPEEEGSLYISMVSSIRSQGGKIKGVLWYQGCSEAIDNLADNYLEGFKSLVAHLRKDIDNNGLPFLTVQLNRVLAQLNPGLELLDEESDRNWGKLREAQRQAAKKIPHVFIIPSLDCNLSDVIHNSSSSNMVLGERLARMALGEIYNKNCLCRAPEISTARKADKNQIVMEFENVSDKLDARNIGTNQFPFSVEDENGNVGITEVRIEGADTIRITTVRELSGKSFVHCAYEQNPKQFIPIDLGSYLPLLSFYNVEVN